MFLQTIALSRSVLLLAPTLLTTQLKLLMVLLLSLISRLILNRHGRLPKLLLMSMPALVLRGTSLFLSTLYLPQRQQRNALLEWRLLEPTANPLAYLLAIH
jgi:hypothetical protein